MGRRPKNDAENVLDDKALRQKVKELLRKKPYLNGKEIAEILSISSNRVYSVFSDVKTELYKELGIQ